MPTKFIAKNQIEVLLRKPLAADLPELLSYVNNLSREDTFLTLSGEEVTREEESAYLDSVMGEIEKGDRIQYLAFAGSKLVANGDIHRVKRFRKRCLHVGEVAISVARNWRRLGIGQKLIAALIADSSKMGIKLLVLDVFSENTKAIGFYKKMGFRLAGEIPGAVWYKGRYIGQVHMYLSLE